MTGRVLYFAEPIDNAPEAPEWRAAIDATSQIATKRGWLVYRPSRSWDVGSGAEVGPEIETVNRVMMANSAAVVAHFPPGVPTIGAPRELEWAQANDMPAIAMYTGPLSWSLFDCDNAEFGDLAGFGQWLVNLERLERFGARSSPLTFLLETGGKLPTRSNEGDAGFDLYVSEDVQIDPGQFVDVPCGCRVAFPPDVWGRITGRSSTTRKLGLLVIEGVIDTGYRGPLFAGVRNLGADSVVIHKGDRIVQLLLHDNVAARHVAVPVELSMWNRIPGDSRGESGFGSTGD